ncbi:MULTISPECIES: hypothetical protein [unclassified Mesorhizobium]|jgi:hypothetical protein|uniref:hypothetical protein n=1 Tax=unclassified Mesorhizobium TaxID=325217 RepID=UPI000FCADF5F|nr:MULTISPECIES: hypothetical protein [unclassified Mesorhizobium]RUU24391.1 hypothetical protein EOD10_01695 [Mesorhizobium sp. M7A.T.Ca.TU.009.01.3.2]RUV14476.1 hypothetical protein EOD00_01435 [Mesorhizobium sp. M7A.T.Ca.TU.009.01.3.1]RUV53027.1 hypothetical protein EOB77_03925 [Mesorhizobium sp. M7A.F.Ca.MR.228.00.0.0]AZV17638.1 hypothetical protein EJ079_00170 [Mesorhizobium sp. M7A.F.Ce.TU.012.03.2.1]RUU89199.1 hypothetical protein EOB59_19790 [Mesorhizobium sp. M7A.F.Ca.MR.176.00.0.0]
MQMMGIVVSRDQAPIVEFRGEGGECITVTLQAGHTLPDDQLIAKAKAMMIQVAQFGMDQTNSAAMSDRLSADEVIQSGMSG